MGGTTGGMLVAGTGGVSGAGAAGAGQAGLGGASGISGVGGAPNAGSGGAGDVPQAGAGTAGEAGTTADAGDASLPDDAGVIEPPFEDLGEGDGSDVVTIGDSWMNNTLLTGGAIEGALARLTGQPYRNYAVQGVELLRNNLFGGAVPTQYAAAKRQDPEITTVIMTGGGNDIIQNAAVQASCDTGGEECKAKLAEIAAALDTLWSEMSADGVKDVIYVRYARDAGSTDDSVRGEAEPPPICIAGPIRCHSIDTTEAVMAELQDGIHPTRAANDRIALVINEYMIEKGIRR